MSLERSLELDATISALAVALELREDESGGHTVRVSELALRLARETAPEIAGDRGVRIGFLLHDVGKIAIPDAVLLKRGGLTDDERRQVEQHPILGEHLVSSVSSLAGQAREIILHHHERWDGAGYPWGLTGSEIPIAARIFALADAFDAMTNDRPYREALPVDEALARIIDGAGTQFDPALVSPFVVVAGSSFRAARPRRTEADRATTHRVFSSACSQSALTSIATTAEVHS